MADVHTTFVLRYINDEPAMGIEVSGPLRDCRVAVVLQSVDVGLLVNAQSIIHIVRCIQNGLRSQFDAEVLHTDFISSPAGICEQSQKRRVRCRSTAFHGMIRTGIVRPSFIHSPSMIIEPVLERNVVRKGKREALEHTRVKSATTSTFHKNLVGPVGHELGELDTFSFSDAKVSDTANKVGCLTIRIPTGHEPFRKVLSFINEGFKVLNLPLQSTYKRSVTFLNRLSQFGIELFVPSTQKLCILFRDSKRVGIVTKNDGHVSIAVSKALCDRRYELHDRFNFVPVNPIVYGIDTGVHATL